MDDFHIFYNIFLFVVLLCNQMLLLFGGTSYPWGVNSNADVVAFNLKDKKWSILECTGDKRPPGKYGQVSPLSHEFP